MRIPFKFRRIQFRILVSFIMTINKSQDQSLKHIKIYFPHYALPMVSYMLPFLELLHELV